MEATILKTWATAGRTISKIRDEDGDVSYEVTDADGQYEATCDTLAEARDVVREAVNADLADKISDMLGDLLSDADVSPEAAGRKLRAIIKHLGK